MTSNNASRLGGEDPAPGMQGQEVTYGACKGRLTRAGRYVGGASQGHGQVRPRMEQRVTELSKAWRLGCRLANMAGVAGGRNRRIPGPGFLGPAS